MLKRVIRSIPVVGITVFSLAAGTAQAQWLPFNNCNSCAPPPVIQNCCPQPVVQCPIPVTQTTYRQVPVTEYRPVQQTVMKPVVETKYVDQQVTAYRQVLEPRTVDVPCTTYQNVTECRQVQKDMGRWVTQRQCIPRVSPCAYDSRPNLMGWMNRTGYSMRMAFTPQYRTTRHYVPNVVTQNVPVTRQVAVRQTRKVTYNVARMVPYTTTRKVAVNSTRYVKTTVTAMKPVTVMRSIPTTRTAYVYPSNGGFNGTATALLPTPEPYMSAGAPEPIHKRSASNKKKYDDSFDANGDKYERDPASDPRRSSLDDDSSFRRSSYEAPQESTAPAFPPTRRAGYEPDTSDRPLPSIVRASGWTRRVPRSEKTAPVTSSSDITVAQRTP
ncbi:hypothetical protein Pan241w_10250 [Gimesia alba]|uniref:Uncharacterized protein n=1 Tax=Gimesia alba TaxID=2527973 RepID=A0A517RAP5_9PLAN|nr:hypothetical protein [Gimesia alba]QDT40966.1 hypothetical protein Pan241w_10250 [Gimesia alba]